MAGVRRQFSDEFKQKAVRVVTVGGVSMAQSPRDLEIRADLLRFWMRTATNDAAAAASGGQSARVDQAELTRLPTEVATLRMERDILKMPRNVQPLNATRTSFCWCDGCAAWDA